MVKRYSPDTNFFFECRKANDLAWSEIAPDIDEIDLIVAPTVITEIERHKQKGNSRTAKRAREASALLRKALQSTDQKTVVRSASPKVHLALPPVFAVQFEKFPQLDRNRADHCIVAELARMRETWTDLELLTDDTLSALAARSIGLSLVMIPESWKLQPERDERDTEIEALQKEVRFLKTSTPDLDLAIVDGVGNSLSELTIVKTEYYLSEADEEAAINAVKARHPMKADFTLDLYEMAAGHRPPTEREISAYHANYINWVEATRERLRRLPALYSSIREELLFSIRLENTGYVNAERVRLQIIGFDGITIANELRNRDLEARTKALALPPAVQPPKGKSIDDMMLAAYGAPNRFADMDHLRPMVNIPAPEDPYTFYFVDVPPRGGAQRVDLRCALFPHQGQPYTLKFRGFLAQDSGKSPRITVRVEASNLKKPVERTIAVELVSKGRENILDLLRKDGVV